MPPKKRQSKQKNSTANVAAEASPSNSMAISVENASLDDLIQGYWASDAAQHNFNESVMHRVYSQIAWEKCEIATLQKLEASGYFENYLWKHFGPTSTYDHVHSIVLLINEKFRGGVCSLESFCEDADKFELFFGSFTSHYAPSLDIRHKYDMAQFALNMYKSLENATIRQSALRFISLQMWSTLPDDRLVLELRQYPQLQKHWDLLQEEQQESVEKDLDTTPTKGRKRKASAKKQSPAKKCFTVQSCLNKEKTWMPNLIVDYLSMVEGERSDDMTLYILKFTELLIDLVSQLPTRRFLVTVLDSLHLTLRCKAVTISSLFAQLVSMLDIYVHFEMNSITGEPMSRLDVMGLYNERLHKLQQLAYAHYKDELVDLIYSSTGELGKSENLSRHLSLLSPEQVFDIAVRLGHMSKNTPVQQRNPSFVMQVLTSKLCPRLSQIEEINRTPLFPDEKLLWDLDLIPPGNRYDGRQVLALPKLNLQFLTMHDYLLRNFILYRLESAYNIRQDITDAIRRVGPRQTLNGPVTFGGWARMATPICSISIDEVSKPSIGDVIPARVTCSVEIDVSRYTGAIRDEWEALRQHDVVFLLCIRNPKMEAGDVSNKYTLERKDLAKGLVPHKEYEFIDDETSFPTTYGVAYVRGGEIFEVKDEEGIVLNDLTMPDTRVSGRVGTKRKLRLNLDAAQYYTDMKDGCDCYEYLNLLIRRKSKENNFHAVLRTIRELMNITATGRAVPTWLHDVLLGYGSPAAANYKSLQVAEAGEEANIEEFADYVDTFVDYQHLVESFPSSKVEVLCNEDTRTTPETAAPPFTLTIKRGDVDRVVVRPYHAVSMGPYGQDILPKNNVRYTPAQVEVIRSGMNKGLTVCVGPPGSGKSDVATQVIVNLYHNFPNEKILLVTHSNAALNDMFEKLVSRDVDSRHLLRLGSGERTLKVGDDDKFNREGRVNWSLARRLTLLEQVQRLAHSLNISGDVGYTCETAEYFFLEHIQSRIDKFTLALDKSTVAEAFPFQNFFADAPQPLFHGDDSDGEIAMGCIRYIKNIFAELADYRAFEVLRTHKHRSDYLLTKQARIIAMTCTHAAIARQRFVDLGFKFDSLVMEEAAQMFEIETLIPILLQNIDIVDGCRLKRVVLIGDHLQLPPVAKHPVFQRFSHLDQSLFTRFIRLGVPFIQLDAQGRARHEISALYSWRYVSKSMPAGLKNLPIIKQQRQYGLANAGFAHVFQCVNVPAFQGKGEFCPTPYFYQNLGEAEYVVATYQYMRLLGYPANKISILTTYNGQKHLIRDVLKQRCKHPIFGQPHRVTTVDKYQGQQNDYVLLSLVRTETIGHLRDIRRFVVSVSRARLGLYVFCRQNLFAQCLELQPTFNQFLSKPLQLEIVEKETYPTARDSQSVRGKVIADVTEMGVLVYNMAQEVIARNKTAQHEVPLAIANTNDSDNDNEPDMEVM